MGQSKSEAAGFLRDLFGDAPSDGAHIALWTKASKRTDYLGSASEAERFEDKPDVYVQATLVGKSRGKRPGAKDSVATPGVWADIDVAGGPDDPPGKLLAPDVDAALEIANGILTPTIVVHSGYGVQAWWLLEEPWVFENDEERSQAGRMVHGWQRLLRNAALDKGFAIDHTHDLARLMRLPGTINDKGPEGVQAKARVLEDDGPRFTMEEIAGFAMAAAPLTERSAADRVAISPERRFPVQKFEALRDNHETFRATWEHTRRDRETKGWSASEFDLSLASMAVNAGWTDDEVAELIAEHRRKHYGADDGKAQRVDYLQRTIARARQNAKTSERQEHQDAAIDEMAHMAEQPNGAVDPSKTMALFNEIIGGGREGAPVLKELVQYGNDPDDARFVFVLADGREVNVGPYANLRQTRRLDERIGPSTGFVMNKVKEDERWVSALTALLRTAQVREEGEDKTREWVKRYTDDRLGGTRDEAAREGEPFEDEGWIHVKAAPLARYVRGVMRERISQADLVPLLRRAGFEQQTVHYETKDGGRSTGSYWRISKGDLA